MFAFWLLQRTSILAKETISPSTMLETDGSSAHTNQNTCAYTQTSSMQVGRIIKHEAFPQVCAKIKGIIEEHCQRPLVQMSSHTVSNQAVTLVLFCKSGRDRSVGLSVVVDRAARAQG